MIPVGLRTPTMKTNAGGGSVIAAPHLALSLFIKCAFHLHTEVTICVQRAIPIKLDLTKLGMSM